MDFYELLLAKKLNGGGGSSVTVESLSVTENGTYTAPTGKAYSPVNVNVGGGGGSLPAEYQEVEYIGVSGGAIINLGAREYTNIGYDTTLLVHQRNNNYGPHYISCTNNFVNLGPRGASGSLVCINGGGESTSLSTTELDKITTFTANKAGDGLVTKTVDGVTTTGTATVGSTTTGTIILFAYSQNVSQNLYWFIGNFYSLELYSNAELVEKFVPCYRKADNVIGIYEIMNGGFYTNDGTGSFTKGDDVLSNNRALSILLGE